MERALLLLFAAFLAAIPSVSFPAEYAVDLKNDGAMAVSVPLGTDDGVTPESDFEVVVSDNVTVPIYPLELYERRFWSQPLSEEVYGKIREGMAVRPSAPSGRERARVRSEGRERQAAIRAKREEARREALGREIDALREKKAALEDLRDGVEDRIARAEMDLADEEGRLEWAIDSEDREVDRALQKILDLGDRRDELQERRLALSGERPLPREEIDRLTAEVRRLNDRIETERGSIRLSRDRRRSARQAFVSRRQEWRKLVAERNRLDAEIGTVDRKIRDLAHVLR